MLDERIGCDAAQHSDVDTYEEQLISQHYNNLNVINEMWSNPNCNLNTELMHLIVYMIYWITAKLNKTVLKTDVYPLRKNMTPS